MLDFAFAASYEAYCEIFFPEVIPDITSGSLGVVAWIIFSRMTITTTARVSLLRECSWLCEACSMRLFITKSRRRLHYYIILCVWFYGPIPVFGIDPRYRTSGIDNTSTLVLYCPPLTLPHQPKFLIIQFIIMHMPYWPLSTAPTLLKGSSSQIT